jgi:hypothetical protein
LGTLIQAPFFAPSTPFSSSKTTLFILSSRLPRNLSLGCGLSARSLISLAARVPALGKHMFAAGHRIHGLTALVGIVGNTLSRASREGWSSWSLLSWSRCHPVTG